MSKTLRKRYFKTLLSFLASLNFAASVHATTPQGLPEEQEISVQSSPQSNEPQDIEAFLAAHPEIAKELEKEQTKLFEEKYKQVQSILVQLQIVLQNLSQIVSNNQLRNINKAQALTTLREIQMLANSISSSPMLNNNFDQLITILYLSQAMIDYTLKIVESGLKELPQFNPGLALSTRSGLNKIRTKEDFEEQMENTLKDLEDLKAAEQTVGRSVWQRAFKKASTFCSEYSIHSKTLKLAIAGAAGAFIVANVNRSALPSWLQGSKDIVGNAPLFDPNNQLRVYTDSLGTEHHQELSKPFHWYALLVSTGLFAPKFDPIASYSSIAKYFANDFNLWWTWLKTKAINVHNYCTGEPAVKSSYTWLIDPRYNLDDIIGNEGYKTVLMRYVEYILDPEKFDRAGATPEKGLLLVGPPQTGKSFTAEALAGTIKKEQKARGLEERFSFLSFTAEEIRQGGLDYIMWLAQQHAPCVVFLDEIDLLRLQRDGDSKLLGELLTSMSGFVGPEKSKQVIIMAATNKPESLDQALLQHGRFGKVLTFDYPSLEERTAFLAKRLIMELGLNLSPLFINKIAKETESCTFNALRSIVTTAINVAKDKNELLSERHVEDALDEEIRRIMPQRLHLPLDQQKLIAVHQAGHAVATVLLNKRATLSQVTIRPMTHAIKEEAAWNSNADGTKKDMKLRNREAIEFGNIFTRPKESASLFVTQHDMKNDLLIALAGHAAEELIFGVRSSYHAKQDNDTIFETAYTITFKGRNRKVLALPDKLESELGEKAYMLIESCEQEIAALLAPHREIIEKLAQALVEKQALTGRQVCGYMGCTHEDELLEQKAQEELMAQMAAELAAQNPAGVPVDGTLELAASDQEAASRQDNAPVVA